MYLGSRLHSFYVWGSVHRNEAVPGVSDLDTAIFIKDPWDKEKDEGWLRSVNKKLSGSFMGVGGLSRPHHVDEVLKGMRADVNERDRTRTEAWMHRLRYDATLLEGQGITGPLDLFSPGPAWASEAFQSTLDLARVAVGRHPEDTLEFKLPAEPRLRLRKLARLGVLGGAYLLMGQHRFQSYKWTAVLPPIAARFPRWNGFLQETAGLCVNLTPLGADGHFDYPYRLMAWLDWVQEGLNAEMAKVA
ncbi:MAG: hypothetical protein AMXMBFR7_17610 [Planctomycetota bacterium]